MDVYSLFNLNRYITKGDMHLDVWKYTEFPPFYHQIEKKICCSKYYDDDKQKISYLKY